MSFAFPGAKPVQNPEPIIVLAGPTASGKTALSIALAQAIGGEILSADSRQIYKRCSIVTAKPTLREQEQAKHHLIDIAEPHELFSAAQWAQSAREVLEDMQARGKRAIVCGGTGFYIRALLEPDKIAAPSSDAHGRAEIERECDEIGLEAAHARLQVLAPERASKIHPNDRYRIVRALEIARYPQPPSTCAAPAFIAFRLSWPREELYKRIEARVDHMIELGAWDEMQALLDAGVPREAPVFNGVGYRQMMPALDGMMSRDEAVAKWKQETRRLAKRQETWFGHQLPGTALDAARGIEAMAEQVLGGTSNHLQVLPYAVPRALK